MAGQTDANPSSGIMPEIEFDDPFERMNGTLDLIWKAVTGRDGDTEILDLAGGGARTQQHVRLRVSMFVFSCDAAATITLAVGTGSRTFVLGGPDTKIVPLPIVVERGMDITLTATAGNVSGYFVGTRE